MAASLKEISGRLRSLVEKEKGNPLPASLVPEKEALAAELESWLGTLDPRSLGEEELKSLADTLVTLRSDAGVSALLSKVRRDLVEFSRPPESRPAKPAATYGKAGSLQAPLASSKLNKTY
jgi:hypothetical protein